MSRSLQHVYRSENLLKQYVMPCSVQLQNKIRKNSLRRSCSPKYAKCGHFTWLFCTGRLRNVQKDLWRTRTDIVLLAVLVAVAVVVCWIKPPKRRLSECYFVGNTLTWTEAIEIYTLNDVTSSSSRKTTIAFFTNFGWIEKLFCVPEQSLN